MGSQKRRNRLIQAGYAAPGCVSILRTEFHVGRRGIASRHRCVLVRIPLRVVGIPRLLPIARKTHRENALRLSAFPPDGWRNSHFTPNMFAGDAVLIEVDSPQRFGQSGNARGRCCGAVWGRCAKKKKIEGLGATEAIFLGFRVNLETKRIRLPGENIEG